LTASHRSLTLGSVRGHVIRLATPTAIEMALYSATGLLHAYWMGRVGSLALAAVSMATTLRLVLISPMMGLSAGGMALVAREIGAGERRRADHACAQTLALVALVVAPLILVGQLWAPTFLSWIGASERVLDDGLGYFRIILWGLFFMECMPTMNGVIRGAGRPEFTLRITIASRLVFFALEPVLALGWGPFPALGVRGVALAEVLASVAGVAAQALVLLPKGGCLTIHLRDLAPNWSVMRRVLRVALPCSAQRLSPNLASALFMRLVAGLGDSVLAGYAIFTQVQTFVQGPNAGLQSAAATMVGQNLGAEQPQRAALATWWAAGLGAAVSLALYGLADALAPTLLPMLNSDPAAVAAGRQVLRYALVFGVFNGLWLVLGNALSGAGDAAATMLINLVALWVVQLPACWLLAGAAGLGSVGIWLGMIIGSVTNAAGMAWRFRTGKWKTMRV
jgi:putative MATE family efflux protein